MRAIPLICVFVIGLISCKKESGNIVITGQSDANQLNIHQTDTFSILTTTIREDSLPGNNISYALLGELNDPLLGRSKASIFAKSNIVEPENDFPNAIDADSAILFIPVVDGLNFYGNPAFKQRLTIYPLSEAITPSNVYYQQETVKYNKSVSTQYYGTMYHQKYDSIGFRKQKLGLKAGLYIKLSTEFANYLQHLPKDAFKTNEGLSKYFKGIAIVPENDELTPGNGGYCVYDLNNTISNAYRAKILLYYNDTSTFMFGFDGKAATVNNGNTGPYPTFVNDQLNTKNGSFKTTYVQALGGLKTKISIPHLLNLLPPTNDKGINNVAINHAELWLYTSKQTTPIFFAPPRMNLFQPLNAHSDRNKMIEDALVSPGSFGGVYNESGKYYKFEITRHIQNILNDWVFHQKNSNLGMYFALPSDNPVIGARAGIDHSKTRLIITYTKPN